MTSYLQGLRVMELHITLFLDCCDLHLAALTFTIVFVTTMVLVTASTPSGRVSRFLMVRRIGCAVCRQPEPVGLGSTRRMPNHLRKIRTCHGREDRLRGITPQTPGGTHTPTRTSPLSHADHPRHTLLGSRDDGSVPVTIPAGPKTRAIADQNTTVESFHFMRGKVMPMCFVRRGDILPPHMGG
jgi:hypothetical protein